MYLSYSRKENILCEYSAKYINIHKCRKQQYKSMRDLKSKLLLNFINSKFQRSLLENKRENTFRIGRKLFTGLM